MRVGCRRNAGGVQLSVALRGRPFVRAVPSAAPGVLPRAIAGDFKGPKLNVGGGKGHPPVEGWQIVDLRERSADLLLDIATSQLPFADGSVALIFCSHTLEHIPRNRLHHVLSEFRRVLRPSGEGLLRVLVPDIELAVRAFAERDHAFFLASEVSQADPSLPLGGLLANWFYSVRGNDRNGLGHVNCFDYENMEHWLREAGFAHVWRSAYRQSFVEELRGEAFDRHPIDSLCVEAMP